MIKKPLIIKASRYGTASKAAKTNPIERGLCQNSIY